MVRVDAGLLPAGLKRPPHARIRIEPRYAGFVCSPCTAVWRSCAFMVGLIQSCSYTPSWKDVVVHA